MLTVAPKQVKVKRNERGEERKKNGACSLGIEGGVTSPSKLYAEALTPTTAESDYIRT